VPGRSNSAVGSNPNAPSTVVTLGDMYEGKIVAGNGLRTPSGLSTPCAPHCWLVGRVGCHQQI
jgi:hypothetical protein